MPAPSVVNTPGYRGGTPTSGGSTPHPSIIRGDEIVNIGGGESIPVGGGTTYGGEGSNTGGTPPLTDGLVGTPPSQKGSLLKQAPPHNVWSAYNLAKQYEAGSPNISKEQYESAKAYVRHWEKGKSKSGKQIISKERISKSSGKKHTKEESLKSITPTRKYTPIRRDIFGNEYGVGAPESDPRLIRRKGQPTPKDGKSWTALGELSRAKIKNADLIANNNPLVKDYYNKNWDKLEKTYHEEKDMYGNTYVIEQARPLTWWEKIRIKNGKKPVARTKLEKIDQFQTDFAEGVYRSTRDKPEIPILTFGVAAGVGAAGRFGGMMVAAKAPGAVPAVNAILKTASVGTLGVVGYTELKQMKESERPGHYLGERAPSYAAAYGGYKAGVKVGSRAGRAYLYRDTVKGLETTYGKGSPEVETFKNEWKRAFHELPKKVPATEWSSKDVASLKGKPKAIKAVNDVTRKYKPKIIGSTTIEPQTTLTKPPRGTAGDIDIQQAGKLGSHLRTKKLAQAYYDALVKAGFKPKMTKGTWMGKPKYHITLNGEEVVNIGTSTKYYYGQIEPTSGLFEKTSKAWTKDPHGVPMSNIRDQMRVKIWKGYIEKARAKDIIDVHGIYKGTMKYGTSSGLVRTSPLKPPLKVELPKAIAPKGYTKPAYTPSYTKPVYTPKKYDYSRYDPKWEYYTSVGAKPYVPEQKKPIYTPRKYTPPAYTPPSGTPYTKPEYTPKPYTKPTYTPKKYSSYKQAKTKKPIGYYKKKSVIKPAAKSRKRTKSEWRKLQDPYYRFTGQHKYKKWQNVKLRRKYGSLYT